MHTQSTALAALANSAACAGDSCLQLRFEPLFHPGGALPFPCAARGCVELDGLSAPARRSYFYACAVVGREFAARRWFWGQARIAAPERVR